MSLFARGKAAPASAPDMSLARSLSFSQWVVAMGGGSAITEQSAQTINTALRDSVVYRCVTLVAGTVATFPVHAKRGRVTLDPGPRIVSRPSLAVRRSVWVEQAVSSMLLRGGAYGLVDMPLSGYPTQVDLIHPDRVDWTERDGWLLDRKPVEEYPLGPLWQVPLHVIAGSPKGLNPLEYARKTIYAKLIAQEFGSNFFRDGGHPTALLAPETDPGVEGAKALKAAFREATTGNREPVVLPQSTTYTPLQINPEDSQFLNAMRFSAEETARFFGVTSAMADIVVSGTSLTYSNITDRREDFKQFTLLLPMHRLEEAMTELIPRPQSVKFNPAGLLKGSITERYATYKTAAEINNLTGETFMSVDEMRDFEDWEPIEATGTDPAPVVDDPARYLPTFNVNIDARQEPPVVNIAPTEVKIEPQTVNVDARHTTEVAPVTVRMAEQLPPVVNVAAPEVTINQLPPAPALATRKRIEHTSDGRIAAIIEEPIP